LIQSRKNTPSFNPIHDFFLNNQNVVPDNEFEKLKACFTIDAKLFYKDQLTDVDDYLEIYLKKWLLGIIGSSFGTYSLMILVLVGEQGIKKTEFFRNLLPKDLQKYYSESNLDEGKDSEILMCKKLLIVDDEFGGDNDGDSPVEVVQKRQLIAAIARELEHLPERDRRILDKRFGISSGEPQTLDDVARQEGVTRERIRQIEQKTLARLRHPNNSQRLRSFLEAD
jgi:RNA polymerase sigma factor (sigma-70 family)